MLVDCSFDRADAVNAKCEIKKKKFGLIGFRSIFLQLEFSKSIKISKK